MDGAQSHLSPSREDTDDGSHNGKSCTTDSPIIFHLSFEEGKPNEGKSNPNEEDGPRWNYDERGAEMLDVILPIVQVGQRP